MISLENLINANPHLKIHTVDDAEFNLYGRVVQLPQQTELADLLDATEIPEQNNIYICDMLDWLHGSRSTIEREYFGEQSIQIGYCNGHSDHLNALEFHNSSEINVAGTDLVLFMAHRRSIDNQWVDTKKVEAFFVPRGTAIEVYATTMHFAPCEINERGFRCLVILPQKTNGPLKVKTSNSMLFQHNKWLLTHPDNQRMVAGGARIGIRGENYAINKIKE